jgi:hypothetical protein
MSIAEIEAAIAELPRSEVDRLVRWLSAHYADLWDKQIAEDVDAGRLDGLLDEVENEIGAGLATPL